MRFLERTAERLQLENDNLKAENGMLKAQIDFMEQSQKTDEAYAELMADFEMTEDFRCQVETENAALKAQVTNLTNLLEEALDNLEESVNENDRLEAKNYDLKCDLCEARTDLAGLQLSSSNIVIKQLIQSLKAAGIIPQQTEVNL